MAQPGSPEVQVQLGKEKLQDKADFKAVDPTASILTTIEKWT